MSESAAISSVGAGNLAPADNFTVKLRSGYCAECGTWDDHGRFCAACGYDFMPSPAGDMSDAI